MEAIITRKNPEPWEAPKCFEVPSRDPIMVRHKPTPDEVNYFWAAVEGWLRNGLNVRIVPERRAFRVGRQ